mgnify:CR=1 FL=1
MCTGVEIALAFQAIGTTTAVAGTGAAVYGATVQSAASQKAEEARKRQMELDNLRKQREVARNTQLNRAKATSNAVAQGAGDSTGVEGGYGQIQQTGGEDLNYLTQSLDIGRDLFNANAQSAYGQGISAVGNGVNNLGLSLIKASPTIGVVGADLFGDKSNNVNL